METETLFNLGFNHWEALLLSLIPAFISLSCIIYFSKFPAYTINRVYLLFLFSLFSWQLNDCFSRMSVQEETARAWDKLLSLAWVIVIPSGIHWILLLTGKRRLTGNYWFIVCLYFPAFVISVLLSTGRFSQAFVYLPFWGWTKTYHDLQSPIILAVLWFFAGICVTLFLFGSFAYKNRKSPELKFISFLIFIGYAIPGVQAILTQILFPLAFRLNPVPITSTLMMTIILVIIEIKAYKMFYLSETLDSERIAEMIQEIIFVVSPQFSITYMNAYGLGQMQTAQHGKMLQGLFPGSGNAYALFRKQVLEPAFSKMSPSVFPFSMHDHHGKAVHWEVTTYPVVTRKKITSLLVICRDISDQMILGEARLAALRSQMNPHFIFNSLNSIQHYIHSGQNTMAESFLSAFSQLIRKILDSSVKTSIPLSDELATLELYLHLEKARFGNRLNYYIDVDESLDTENVLIPSMLIQPYIENAIIHGIAPKDEGGAVHISLQKVPDRIMCTIEDNGIGREKAKAKALQDMRTVKSNSYGMSITQSRLDILNQHLHIPVSVEITDLFGDGHQPQGTRVTISLPVEERF